MPGSTGARGAKGEQVWFSDMTALIVDLLLRRWREGLGGGRKRERDH